MALEEGGEGEEGGVRLWKKEIKNMDLDAYSISISLKYFT